MALDESGLETEIKLRLASASEGRNRLRRAGFKVWRRRALEIDQVFDTEDLRFRRSSSLLRLRRVETLCVLTFKGPPRPGKHKSREEIEVEFSGAAALEQILLRIGLKIVFGYEKYRTKFAGPEPGGIAALDETPIGVFLELEGTPDWIDRMAGRLGFQEADYITESYAALYEEYCRERRIVPTSMLFAHGRK